MQKDFFASWRTKSEIKKVRKGGIHHPHRSCFPLTCANFSVWTHSRLLDCTILNIISTSHNHHDHLKDIGYNSKSRKFRIAVQNSVFTVAHLKLNVKPYFGSTSIFYIFLMEKGISKYVTLYNCSFPLEIVTFNTKVPLCRKCEV